MTTATATIGINHGAFGQHPDRAREQAEGWALYAEAEELLKAAWALRERADDLSAKLPAGDARELLEEARDHADTVIMHTESALGPLKNAAL